MINEGQFETSAKTTVSNTKIEKELRSLGLGYNGGDPVYTNDKKNATIASWSLIPNKKAMNLLKANGEFSYPLSYGNNYYLEYNIRTKKFTIVRELWTPSKGTKWFNPVEIKNPEVLNSPIFKRVEEIAAQMKRNTQVVFTGGNKAYYSAYNYGKEHLKEDHHETINKIKGVNMCYFNEEQEMLEEGERFNKFKKGARNAALGAVLGASLGAGGMRYHMNKNAVPVKEKQAIERTDETDETDGIAGEITKKTRKAFKEMGNDIASNYRKDQKTKPEYETDGISGVVAKNRLKEKTKEFINGFENDYRKATEHLKEEVNYFPY